MAQSLAKIFWQAGFGAFSVATAVLPDRVPSAAWDLLARRRVRVEHRTERLQCCWMVNCRMFLLRHLLIMPMDPRRRIPAQHLRQPLHDLRILVLVAADEIERLLQARPRTQPLCRAIYQFLIVPPKAGVYGDIGIKQLGLQEKRL